MYSKSDIAKLNIACDEYVNDFFAEIDESFVKLNIFHIEASVNAIFKSFDFDKSTKLADISRIAMTNVILDKASKSEFALA